MFRSVFVLHLSSQEPIDVATFNIIWSRKGNESERSEFRHTIGEMKVAFNEITISIDMPAMATLRSLLPVRYRITNKSITKVHSLNLTMDPSNAFMFSGCKQTVFIIQPN
uniref:Trafficking protein particle complex subunit 11 n=1 Tax=Triatoma infestans TaxID=30076 RepID=A0A161M1F4_TRIIF